MNVRRVFFLGTFVLGLIASAAGLATAAPPQPEVVVVPLHGTIDDGMAHLVERSIADAEASHARAVVLDIDTFGGLVSAATEIRDAEVHSTVPVYAYIDARAWSAGALVALASEKLAMAPGSSIGDAQPIPNTVKNVSALREEFAATAARRHRNAQIATAMVDVDASAPPYSVKGRILTLQAEQAQAAGIANAVVPNLGGAVAAFGLSGLPQRTQGYSFAEQLARFATNPEISGLLLALGFLGLLIEMQTLHGIAGTIGVGALALFFGTHVYAGFADSIVVALAIAGVVGILLELHVLPGHGFFGVGGVLALVFAVFLAFGLPFFWSAIQALAIAVVVTVAVYAAVVRLIPENAFMRRFAFTGAQGADYVAAADFSSLVGRDGFAASYLRPAGVATVGGQRIDVLTDGDFVTAGTAVRIVRVEGSRIFVQSVERTP